MSNMYTAPFDKIYAQVIKYLVCIKVHELKQKDQYKMKGNKYPNAKISSSPKKLNLFAYPFDE